MDLPLNTFPIPQVCLSVPFLLPSHPSSFNGPPSPSSRRGRRCVGTRTCQRGSLRARVSRQEKNSEWIVAPTLDTVNEIYKSKQLALGILFAPRFFNLFRSEWSHWFVPSWGGFIGSVKLNHLISFEKFINNSGSENNSVSAPRPWWTCMTTGLSSAMSRYLCSLIFELWQSDLWSLANLRTTWPKR